MPARRDRTPIWTRPAPGQRRPRLTREQIAATALAIADADGFEAVSMRRLGDQLGVGTMTLYYYVRTKEDLLALMADALMGEALVADHELTHGWRAGLSAIARASRQAFLRHPWARRALQGAGWGPSSLRHVEQTLAAIADAPLDVRGKLELATIVDDYVFGNVMRLTDDAVREPAARASRAVAEFMAAQLHSGRYPRLAAMVGDRDPVATFSSYDHWITADARFEHGLTALLDGFERAMAASEIKSRSARPTRSRARRRARSDR